MASAHRILGATLLLAALAPAASAQGIDCRNLPASTALPPAECRSATERAPLPDGPVVSGPSDNSFGVDAVNDFLGSQPYVRFAQNNPSGAVNVANAVVAAGDFLNACDFQGNNLSTWYCLSFNGAALTVNPTTGAQTSLGNIAGQWGDMAWSYTANKFYAIQSDCSTSTRFFEVNFTTLTATQVGSTNAATCGVGFAIHPTTGVGYLHDIVSDNVYSVNTSTWTATTLGATGFDGNFAQSMDFDNQDGTLYLYGFNLTDFNNFLPPADLRTVNLSTGATTLIGDITGAATDREITAGSSMTTTSVSTCDLDLAATVNTTTVAPGGTLTFNVTVTNNGGTSHLASVSLEASRNGNTVLTRNIGSATVPAGASGSASFSLRVPANAPSGAYDVDINLDSDGSDCDTESFVITVTAPRVGGGAVPFVYEEGAPFASASATVAATEVVASPNPFAGRTSLSFSLEEASEVRLAVYDVLGREVAVLVDGQLEAGAHVASFEAGSLASGVYVYRLVVGNEVQTGRVTLAR